MIPKPAAPRRVRRCALPTWSLLLDGIMKLFSMLIPVRR